MSARNAFAWSIRRELWEHRSIYLAPLALGLLVVVGFAFHAGTWAEALRNLDRLDAAKQLRVVLIPFGMAASVVLFTSFLVGVVYALDALHGERRDRSILFWKSMPVSDLVTVASKAAIPLAVLPLVGIAIALAAQLLMVVTGSAALAAKGMDPSIPWTRVPWVPATIAMAYGMAMHALWLAPLFGWLFLVSAWSRRSPFLWAVLPPLAVMAVERIAFGTGHFADLLKYRITGGMQAFTPDAMKQPLTQLAQLDPARFLSLPGLWLGLAFALAFLAVAVRLRRLRDPS
jgi:ABC-2 type transport system permease protein